MLNKLPEARGRSERAFGTHQARLPKELALAGITDLAAANAYILCYNLAAFLLAILLPGYAVANEDYVGSLITATPYEGRQLAIKLARKSIGEMQSDSAVKKEVRAKYSRDGAILIEAAEVIAIEFATIAAANNYWRE